MLDNNLGRNIMLVFILKEIFPSLTDLTIFFSSYNVKGDGLCLYVCVPHTLGLLERPVSEKRDLLDLFASNRQFAGLHEVSWEPTSFLQCEDRWMMIEILQSPWDVDECGSLSLFVSSLSLSHSSTSLLQAPQRIYLFPVLQRHM